jgi:hypothetical protein
MTMVAAAVVVEADGGVTSREVSRRAARASAKVTGIESKLAPFDVADAVDAAVAVAVAAVAVDGSVDGSVDVGAALAKVDRPDTRSEAPAVPIAKSHCSFSRVLCHDRSSSDARPTKNFLAVR